jgi:hypothetical protein
MAKLKGLAAVAAVTLFATGCSLTQPNTGNMTDLDNVDFSENLKKESACANYLFYIFGPFGDRSVPDAAQRAGISKVKYVDYELRNYVIVQQRCANVYGK